MHYLHVNCDCRPELPDTQVKLRLLWTALVLIAAFSLVAWAVGHYSQSLALMAEAGHMLSDCGALGLALLATWIGRWPASPKAPFGYRRVEILAALVNGLGLVAIALWVGHEAIERLQHPAREILGVPMLVTAAVGLGVNLVNASLLHDHSHHDLNLKGAFLHVVADALSSVGVILAAIAIWWLGWDWMDGVVSLGVAGLVLAGAVPLIRQSLEVLLEKTPAYLDAAAIQTHLEQFEEVLEVNQLRLWAIAPGQEALAAHLTVAIQDGAGRDRLLQRMQQSLQATFGLRDTVLQMSSPRPAPSFNLSIPERLEMIQTLSSELQQHSA